MRARPLIPVTDLDELRERLDLAGAESLTTAECLALAVRRGSGRAALGWAERLLARFGSLPELLGAPLVDLRREAPPGTVLDLLVVRDLHRRALVNALHSRPLLVDFAGVSDYLRTAMAVERRVQFRVLFLDRRQRLLRDEVMGHGTVDHAPAYPREVLGRALELDASGVVLVHNRPAGDPAPSAREVQLTAEIVAGGRELQVTVHDHLLVAGDQVVSFRQLGLL